ncbi:MAG: exodeoxyribonuclease VII small subunit [Eubacteriales bacterium]
MTKKNVYSYEDRLKQLEDILSKLKGDNLTISEAIALVAEGNKYYCDCNELLDGFEEELEVFSK